MKIVVDIWGGEYSQDHLARLIRPLEEALQFAAFYLGQGYLVNLRGEVRWGNFEEFNNIKEGTRN